MLINVNVNGTLRTLTDEQVDEIITFAAAVVQLSRTDSPYPELDTLIGELSTVMHETGALPEEE